MSTSEETRRKLIQLYEKRRAGEVEWIDLYNIILAMCLKNECSYEDIVELENRHPMRIPPLYDSIRKTLERIKNENDKEDKT